MRKSKFGTKEIKILGLSSLGGTLEFYDFIKPLYKSKSFDT
ncbi:hypothetical protein ACIMQR_000324 [Campylobacter jejuni]